MCRKILKKYQQLCLREPRLRNEELPPISDVSDDEVFQEPIRSFGSLFHGNRRSVLCSGSDVIRENTSIHCESPVNVHLASSTVLDPFSVTLSLPSASSPGAPAQPSRRPGSSRRPRSISSATSPSSFSPPWCQSLPL